MDNAEARTKSHGDASDDQNDSEAAKRRLIQAAMKDFSLSDHDRRLKVRSCLFCTPL